MLRHNNGSEAADRLPSGRRHPSRGGDGQNDADQSQVTPAAHLRAARRACRRAGVPTQRPFTRCMPAPHASRTLMTISSDCWSGVGGIACAEEAKASANATAITRIIGFLLFSWYRREGRRRQRTSRTAMMDGNNLTEHRVFTQNGRKGFPSVAIFQIVLYPLHAAHAFYGSTSLLRIA
jgi:hypothetical protein